MKTIFAAALLAASAIAAEQVKILEPIDPVVIEDNLDDMWTDDDIKTHVSTHFGAPEWDSMNLVTEATRETIAGDISASIVKQWEEGLQYLPHVCEPGVACREKVFADVTVEIQALWKSMFTQIVERISSKKMIVDAKLEKFYEEAYECEPGCTCENIHLEYDQLLKWQLDLTTIIKQTTEDLAILIDEEAVILEECPAYADDMGAYGDQSIQDVHDQGDAWDWETQSFVE